eukprot:Ihof_evm2s491 gene=Ihof_evmTU2s491
MLLHPVGLLVIYMDLEIIMLESEANGVMLQDCMAKNFLDLDLIPAKVYVHLIHTELHQYMLQMGLWVKAAALEADQELLDKSQDLQCAMCLKLKLSLNCFSSGLGLQKKK